MLFRLFTMVFFGVVCAFLVTLGFWQLDRAAQKQERFDAYQRANNVSPLNWDIIRKNHLTSEELLWKRVNLVGYYLDDHVLLDNQMARGRVGYRVFTPFRMTDGTSALIERGWIPMGQTREVVPVFSTPLSKVFVEGYLLYCNDPGRSNQSHQFHNR